MILTTSLDEKGGQELFFKCVGEKCESESTCLADRESVAWEWKQENALRSIVPPQLSVLLPLKLYVALIPGKSDSSLSGFEILIIPRLFLCLISFLTLDKSLWTLIQNSYQNPNLKRQKSMTGLIILASSWPILVFASRPFSNNLEAMVLASLLAIVSINVKEENQTRTGKAFGLVLTGFICAIGVFIRFTFSFFCAPVIVLFIFHTSVYPSKGWKRKFLRTFISTVFVGIGFLPPALAFIYFDGKYYNLQWPVTPINALLYNSNLQNLSTHGLHSRTNHLLVNMPLLFGPIAFFFYIFVFRTFYQRVNITYSQFSFNPLMCKSIIITALLFLSMAPHQEPRFILPLTLPLVALLQSHFNGKRIIPSRLITKSTKVWILFNLVCLVFFGILHQGGILPSLLSLDTYSAHLKESPVTTIYFHTYMPPTFLTRTSPSSTHNHYSCPKFEIIDIMGASIDHLSRTLSQHDFSSPLHLITSPASVGFSNENYSQCSFLSSEYSCTLIWYHYPHLTTEDMPCWTGSLSSFFRQFKLVVYRITKSN